MRPAPIRRRGGEAACRGRRGGGLPPPPVRGLFPRRRTGLHAGALLYSQDPLYRLLELGEIRGLRHVSIRAPAHEAVLVGGVRGVDDDRYLVVLLQDPTHGLDPVHPGHADVHDHEVGRILARLLHGFLGVGGKHDVVTFELQLALVKLPDADLIIGYEDRFHDVLPGMTFLRPPITTWLPAQPKEPRGLARGSPPFRSDASPLPA